MGIKITGIKSLRRAIERKLKLKRGLNRKFKKELAETGAKRIRDRTRREGRGVQNLGGAERKLKKLAKSTIESRERKKKSGKLAGGITSPSRSNLTETGKMLDDIVGVVDTQGNPSIKFKTKRSNDLADIHNRRGASKKRVVREFFFLSSRDVRIIKNKVLRAIRAVLRSRT